MVHIQLFLQTTVGLTVVTWSLYIERGGGPKVLYVNRRTGMLQVSGGVGSGTYHLLKLLKYKTV